MTLSSLGFILPVLKYRLCQINASLKRYCVCFPYDKRSARFAYIFTQERPEFRIRAIFNNQLRALEWLMPI